jgi:PAS domain S-box-containing protein
MNHYAFLPQEQSLADRVQEMEEIARQLAAATEEADQALVELQGLYDVARVLSASLELPKILQATASHLARLTYAQSSAVWMVNDNALRLKAAHHLTPEMMSRLNGVTGRSVRLPLLAQESCLWEAARHKEAIAVQRFSLDRPYDQWLLHRLQADFLVAVPLVVQELVIGLVTLHGCDQRLLQKVDLAKTIVQQAAIVIQNAQLYEEVRQLNQSLEVRVETRTAELVIETSQNSAILASIADGVIASDFYGNILLVNPAAEAILGRSSAALLGGKIADLFGPADGQRVNQLFQTLKMVALNGATAPVEMQEVVFEIGHRIINARLTLARTPNHEAIGMVIALRDITKEVEADRAKTEFISTVSHELRTPMTSIKGYTELMLHDAAGPLTDPQREWLSTVARNAGRLSLLINDLLDVAQIEAGKVRLNLRPVAIRDLVEQVFQTLQTQAEKKGLALVMTAAPDLPSIKVDSDRIIQVLMNLVGNSIAYTEQGAVQVSLQCVANSFRVTVQDSGVGIAPEDMSRIFERFYRADNPVVQANSGTGLGLPIVKTFVEMHGGRIWVDSELGKGSMFTFILPV